MSTQTFSPIVEMYAGNSPHSVIYFDPSSGKVLFFYENSTADDVNVKVGTVANGAITYGAENTIDDDGFFGGDAVTIGDKVVLFYCYGYDELRASVLTVSGDTVTVDSTVTFHSNRSTDISATYSPTTNKAVVCWSGSIDSYKLQTTVCSLSGSTLTFGPTEDHSDGGGNSLSPSLAYEATSDKVIGYFSQKQILKK